MRGIQIHVQGHPNFNNLPGNTVMGNGRPDLDLKWCSRAPQMAEVTTWSGGHQRAGMPDGEVITRKGLRIIGRRFFFMTA
jgi:hypothetical protein